MRPKIRRSGSESPHGPHEELLVFRNFDDERRFEIHVRRTSRLIVLLGRRKVIDKTIHPIAAMLFQRIVEAVAGLSVILRSRTAIVIVSDGQQLVDCGKLPHLALVATRLEGRKIVPRTVVRCNVGGHLFHIRPTVGHVIGTHGSQIRFGELAPMQINYIERKNQPVCPFFVQQTNHPLSAVNIIKIADTVPLKGIRRYR